MKRGVIGGRFNGIFGGLLCGTGTLVSGGFRILRPDVEIRESFVGDAFSVPRVNVVFVLTKTGAALPPGDVVQMFATCI